LEGENMTDAVEMEVENLDNEEQLFYDGCDERRGRNNDIAEGGLEHGRELEGTPTRPKDVRFKVVASMGELASAGNKGKEREIQVGELGKQQRPRQTARVSPEKSRALAAARKRMMEEEIIDSMGPQSSSSEMDRDMEGADFATSLHAMSTMHAVGGSSAKRARKVPIDDFDSGANSTAAGEHMCNI
jgi:hypothetical protein